VGGSFDSIVPLGILRNLQDAWPGSRLIEVNQGHFGYSAMGAALREFEAVSAQHMPGPQKSPAGRIDERIAG
jgi:hypothetical protein